MTNGAATGRLAGHEVGAVNWPTEPSKDIPKPHDLEEIDATEDDKISLTESLDDLAREPDGVAWVNGNMFATANEGDLFGGTRGFSIFKTNGGLVYDSGNALRADPPTTRASVPSSGRTGRRSRGARCPAWRLTGPTPIPSTRSGTRTTRATPASSPSTSPPTPPS